MAIGKPWEKAQLHCSSFNNNQSSKGANVTFLLSSLQITCHSLKISKQMTKTIKYNTEREESHLPVEKI